MNRRTVAVLAALAAVLAVAGAASPVTAAEQAAPRAVALLDEDKATSAGGNGPVACNGGAQEQSFVVSDNAGERLIRRTVCHRRWPMTSKMIAVFSMS